MNQDLGFAWIEAFGRGPAWRRLLGAGAMLLPDAERAALEDGIRQAARLDRIADARTLVPW